MEFRKCCYCGEIKEVGITNAVDPFIQEIYPEDVDKPETAKGAWCDDCWDSRCDEI